jgi:hypothetical protein
MIGALIGGLIFYGFVTFNRQWIQPQQSANIRLEDLETRQASSQSLFESRLEDLAARIVLLENQQSEDKESLSSLAGDIRRLEDNIADHSKSLDKIDSLQKELQKLAELSTISSTQVAKVIIEQSSQDTPLAALKRDLQVLQAQQFLSRARMYLVQNNYGLASADLRSARDIISSLNQSTTPGQKPVVDSWLERLDMAIGNLPDSPVVASDDLEQAWALLAAGLPNSMDEKPLQATPLPSTSISATRTGTATPASPAPTMTPNP